MKKGQDIAVQFPGLYLVHQNLPGKTVPSHQHLEHLLFLPLLGEITVQTERHQLKVSPGRMAYLPPGTVHSFSSSPLQGERLIALIDPLHWKKAGGAQLPALDFPTSALGRELLFHLLIHPKTEHAASLTRVFIQTLSETADSNRSSQDSLALEHLEGKIHDPRVRKALAVLKGNLVKSISIEAIAREAGLSLRNLNRLFFQETGRTPKQVQTQLRIAKARTLLLAGNHSVTDVALEVGYQSLSQFITSFRQLTGQLPSEIRRLG